jgi:DNA invertase Pin-like site-specific DNA recombinase
MTVTPCIIYVRFSSIQQEKGASIERQLELARAHIAREGWVEAEPPVIDKGRSAWKGDHLSKGNLGILNKRIMAGEIAPGTVLLAEKLDRFSRQERKITRRWLEDVTDLGIGIATVDGGRVYTAQTLQANMVEDIEILIRAELALSLIHI